MLQACGHWPPQSTSVSVPFLIPSEHEGPPAAVQQPKTAVHDRVPSAKSVQV
jgi:hypothetical protein